MEIKHEFSLLPPEEDLQKNAKVHSVIIVMMVLIFSVMMTAFFIAQSPRDFPQEDTVISIVSGQSVTQISRALYDRHIITSPRVFQFLFEVMHGSVKAGDYLFDREISIFDVARRLEQGDYGDVSIRVVIPEGASNTMIAEILKKQLPQFDQAVFTTKTADLEGYLFPDTYFFFPSTTTDQVIQILQQAFITETSDLEQEFLASGHSREDIIIMASILEKEATDNVEERAIISGILWKRIEKNIPLQVDAPFLYILGKGSSELTRNDLETDSPYNTYTRQGLPPTPIGNPSRGAIIAALHPVATTYLYYLHDNDGGVHYGTTYDEHINNKRTYLK